MRIIFKNINELVLLLISFIIFSACSSSRQITSVTPTSEIVIDGKSIEWEGKLRYIENEKCAVGFQNDNNYFYICLETSDKTKIMKILTLGLTTWLEPEEGKILGILFPRRWQHDNNQLPPPRMQNNSEIDFPETLNKRIIDLLKNQSNLQIVNADEFPLYAYPINDPLGFQVSLGVSLGKFVYELRVPLAENKVAPININAYSGENLQITFETGELEKTALEQRGGGMRPMGGGMNPGGGRGGMKPGNRIDRADLSEQFELTLSIILAK